MATSAERLYKEDFYAWTREQAAALRRLADERWNGPLDLLHLAEEVEDLGDRTAANSDDPQPRQPGAFRFVSTASPQCRALLLDQKEPDAARALPADCPYAFDDLLVVWTIQKIPLAPVLL
jgi:Domain of unknown function DUF29